MAKLIMLRGLPGSGKTTWAKEYIKNATRPVKRVNNDDLREMLDSGKWSNINEAFITKMRLAIIGNCLDSGIDVIVDNLNFGKHEDQYRTMARVHNAAFEVRDFVVPLVECARRDALRPNPVGTKVIWRWYEDYVQPKERKRWLEPSDKRTAIICDLDGTLFTRDMNVEKPRGHYDLTRVGEDIVVGPVLDVVDGWFGDLLFVSGREEICREATVKCIAEKAKIFINNNNCRLFMRKAGDTREDSIIKREIFETHIEPFYNVRFVLDDRPKVVQMWRSLGLYVFDCGFGVDF